MQQALDSLAPGFRPVFDGDGTLDAVMEGNRPDDAALHVIAIMNGA